MKLPASLTKNISLLVVIALFVLVVLFQKIHDDLGPPFTTRLTLARRNLLPPQILPYISFGFTNLITDFYWIRAIQDFVAWNGKEGFFIGYFKNITTLDPKFEYPYLFSILTIPQNKNVKTLDVVAGIAQKGIQAIPTSWQIPFYLGTQYYLFTKHYDPAEQYLALAAKKPGAPQGASLVYATFVSRTVGKGVSSYKTSQDLIKVIYDTTDNEMIKKLSGKGIQAGVVTQALEKGILAYKTKYQRYPKNVNELIAVNFVLLPQALLDNFTIEINQRNGNFKIAEKEEQ
jgi:hypothetical protein